MSRNLFAVTGVTALLVMTLACTKSSTPLSPTDAGAGASGTASDGSTLKVTAPVPQSPVNDQRPSEGPARLVVSPATALFLPAIAVKYRFQVFNSAGALVDDSLEDQPRYDVEADLVTDSRYTWHARAEGGTDVGPWSTRASFTAPESMRLDNQILDPLTNGKTVGEQRGGRFLPGQGWQSLSRIDAINYDLDEPCVDNCVLEFTATNFGPREGLSVERDLKWLSMGNAGQFGDFFAFRNQIWKMHLVQRADHNTGIEIIWRNGGTNDSGGDPGDHRIKLNQTPIVFDSDNVYRFRLEWATTGFNISVNDIQIMREGWDFPYNPPVHRVSLGCYPRAESFTGIIYRNIKLRRG
jgi:hypothetical protein